VGFLNPHLFYVIILHRGKEEFENKSIIGGMCEKTVSAKAPDPPTWRMTRWEEYRKFGGCLPAFLRAIKRIKTVGDYSTNSCLMGKIKMETNYVWNYRLCGRGMRHKDII